MRVLAVGDLHTKYWVIEEVEKIIDEYDAVVFCGDYADNWDTPPSASIATWRCLKMFMEQYQNKVHAVIGNHDYAYIHKEIAGRSSGWSPITYQLINAPENKKIKNWLLSLPIMIELDGVTFSHAGLTTSWLGDTGVYSLWNGNSPLWSRPAKYGGNAIYSVSPQVIGHNPSREICCPQENIWCIDTFSTKTDGSPYGDETVLEIIDGKIFKIKRLKNANNSDTTSFENSIS